MTILSKLMIIATFFSVLLSGCSLLRPDGKPPTLAREYLQRAEMVGAAEFAPDEYQQLQQELLQLEKLSRKNRSAEIKERLPKFIEAADNLFYLTLQNISEAETLLAAPQQETELPAKSTSLPTAKGKKPPSPPVDQSIKPRTSYTVSEGEQLWFIAKRPDVYGDSLLWPLLYQSNRDQIKDPRIIYAGQILSIPRNVSEEELEKARNLAKKSDIFSPE